jgi:hypothetical protein
VGFCFVEKVEWEILSGEKLCFPEKYAKLERMKGYENAESSGKMSKFLRLPKTEKFVLKKILKNSEIF